MKWANLIRNSLKIGVINGYSGWRDCLMLDNSHMLKLVRNTLGECDISVPDFIYPARWSHLTALPK
ncbi:hypothetical protein OUZ56_005697 [Daphnia magna]|uniref:Uncharacterized protein n=1 Tax=Daphnia magna TaxID=35525 RepID=A0ABQ9YTI3_9CRUS|nr:hypothetical protein OUZ56_005697 [Daphnia magna]